MHWLHHRKLLNTHPSISEMRPKLAKLMKTQHYLMENKAAVRQNVISAGHVFMDWLKATIARYWSNGFIKLIKETAARCIHRLQSGSCRWRSAYSPWPQCVIAHISVSSGPLCCFYSLWGWQNISYSWWKRNPARVYLWHNKNFKKLTAMTSLHRIIYDSGPALA